MPLLLTRGLWVSHTRAPYAPDINIMAIPVGLGCCRSLLFSCVIACSVLICFSMNGASLPPFPPPSFVSALKVHSQRVDIDSVF